MGIQVEMSYETVTFNWNILQPAFTCSKRTMETQDVSNHSVVLIDRY